MATIQAGHTTPHPYGEAWKRLRKLAFEVYGRRCHLCQRLGADTIDHLDPVAAVGGYPPDISRVRPAHTVCNSRRGKKPVAEALRPASRVW